MYDLENCMYRLQGLRELGVSVAIDDFGTGYSSLSYLQKLPVSRVKIDQSFVHGITSRAQETLPLIRAIVDLAHGLGLTVIAEGVETENQLEALTIAGCDLVQGYLIHRPQPASEVEAHSASFRRTWRGWGPRCGRIRKSRTPSSMVYQRSSRSRSSNRRNAEAVASAQSSSVQGPG